jgi:hypothetical protein
LAARNLDAQAAGSWQLVAGTWGTDKLANW